MDDIQGSAEADLPQIIAISSGKGGVGKTLLSVNLARTLSWSDKRILLVDLDLYNRGSTTLIADSPIIDELTVAGMLELAEDESDTRLRKEISEKEIVKVLDDSGNPIPLYLVPSTTTNSIVRWDQYSYDLSRLQKFMLRAVRELTKKYNLDCIVFDCRPGPEPLFLAASGIATDIILVTEADIVTLNGNINLYRYLADTYQNNSEVLRNVRFVINRIPKGQDIAHIERRYMRRLVDLFKTRPNLASIPFDDAIFQSFGQHRFAVDQLPNSPFSKHIACISVELFSTHHEELLSDRARKMASTLDEPWFMSGAKAFFESLDVLLRPRT
ncbi:MAG: ParA family protein [Chloroflexi bacterium]|nr:ParA family protein [Chloroflexota bacterium]